MVYKSVISTTSSFEEENLEKQPVLAWLAIGALILFSIAGIASGAGSLFRPGYVLLSFAVGAFLYLRYPIMYIGFAWWSWFVTPLLSRMIDLRAGFDDTRFILVAPFAVSLITLHGCLKYLPRAYREGGLPFALGLLGLFYGFLVGLIHTSPINAVRSLLDWLTPVSFSLYLFTNWRNYPKYRDNFQRVFLWAVLLTGIYGVIQYLVAPEWDRFWLISTKLGSMGEPEPLKIRVWSTMASPGPFAVMMMSGLLLLFNTRSPLGIPAAAVGYLSFLLSMVRVMWGCWLFAVISMFTSIRPKMQMRLIISALIIGMCVVPLSTMEPFGDVITDRLESFTNLERDNSAQVRQKIYEDGLNAALSNVLGSGIGNTFVFDEKENRWISIVVDSGIIDTFITLGWLGAIPYVSGLFLLLIKVLQIEEIRFDPFIASSRAIGIGCVLGIPIFTIMIGLSGMFMWGFLAIALAGQKYYQQYYQQSYQEYYQQYYFQQTSQTPK
ncbi:glucose-6-phosphate isomerase [Calothrix sp. NIES-3974]|uniref:glucose-6-phosphate isomerase n=1 Tax=Calothrix sp. NIES-3974 TaxID=2005462 RepID=UPI000B603A10|nr:glucose-6-phosphate isomerase [Calothrix sp. NIES-3974]BAZ07650.1 hypothetical protein NIES3974_43140 [Calothrix sp. NIES-3974]